MSWSIWNLRLDILFQSGPNQLWLLARHQDCESFLLEVVIVGQDFRYRLRLQHIHGYAVLQAVMLVASCAIENKPFHKRIT